MVKAVAARLSVALLTRPQPQPRRGMGRRKIFSVEAALDQAIVLFRQRGFSGASMQAISDRLGISRSSIYATFGDKLSLLEQSLRHYGPTCRVPGLSELRDSGSPRAVLLRLFELTIAAGVDDQCLLINTAIELKNSPPEIAGILQAAFADLVTRFREAIERARTKNEIAEGVDPTNTAHSLLALYLGLWVLIRAGARAPALRAVARQVHSLLPERRGAKV